MGISFANFQISVNLPSFNDLFIKIHKGFRNRFGDTLEHFMTTCFVRVENFDYSFSFMFSVVYSRKRVICKL